MLFTPLTIFHILYHEITIMTMLEKDVEIVKFTLVPIRADFPPGDTLNNVLGHFWLPTWRRVDGDHGCCKHLSMYKTEQKRE